MHNFNKKLILVVIEEMALHILNLFINENNIKIFVYFLVVLRI